MRLQLPSADYIELREFGHAKSRRRWRRREDIFHEFARQLLVNFAFAMPALPGRREIKDAMTHHRTFSFFLLPFSLFSPLSKSQRATVTRIRKEVVTDLNTRCLWRQLRVFATERERFCKIKAFYSNRMYSYGEVRGGGARGSRSRGGTSCSKYFYSRNYGRNRLSVPVAPTISSHWWSSRRELI